MSVKDKVVIGINEKMSASNIAKMCSISLKDVFNVVNTLSDRGIYFFPTYNSDGDIIYSEKKQKLEDPIKLRAKNGMISFVGISDLHVGNMYDDLKRIDTTFNYIINNNIHFVINAGDNVDGPAHENQSIPRRLNTLEEQIEEFLNVYPILDNVITFAVLGDHEKYHKTDDNLSFNQIIKRNRHDIKLFSNGSGIISVNNKEILLCHDSADIHIKNNLTDDQILIAGHSHESRTGVYNNGKDLSLRCILPSLCKLSDYNNVLSGFERFDFEVENGFVKRVYITFYMFKEDYSLMRGPDNVYALQENDSFVRPRRRKM